MIEVGRKQVKANIVSIVFSYFFPCFSIICGKLEDNGPLNWTVSHISQHF